MDFETQYISESWAKELENQSAELFGMEKFKQQRWDSFNNRISEIKGVNVRFDQTEPNYWIGYVSVLTTNYFGGKQEKLKVSVEKFHTKQHMVGFWQIWYYNTNKLVFNYEFKSLEDIVQLIDFNIRLGIKY